MVQLKKLFTPVASLDPEAGRDFMASHPEGTYTLLDVRQPWEYEEAHIPGAKLVPLPRLLEGARELDREKPTIVHCAVGGRSRVAAQMLSGMGFKEVYNLAGGIEAYQGGKVAGPVELNLDLVRGDETPGEVLTLAYGLESGLKLFYDTLAARGGDAAVTGLFAKLAQVEEIHRQRILDLYNRLRAEDRGAARPADSGPPTIMEGGFDIREFMGKNEPYTHTTPQVLELAMMLETQALDLYLRLAGKSAHQAARELLYTLADEEKAHLTRLGQMLEEKGKS